MQDGDAWQQGIFEAIDDSERVLCLYSPDYIRSAPCIDEFNIGFFRHRNEGNVLIPAYLRTADLPTYMELCQYFDVRPGRLPNLAELAAVVVRNVRRPANEAEEHGLPTMAFESPLLKPAVDAPLSLREDAEMQSVGLPALEAPASVSKHFTVSLTEEEVSALVAGSLELDVTVRIRGRNRDEGTRY